MRLLFAGTPAAAVPSLDALLDSGHEIAAVLTRPDAPSGRGRRTTRSPVGARADAAELETLTPGSLRDPGFVDRLTDIAPDLVVVVAYGQLVPVALLDVPPYGWVNLHFSVLPAWRGAAPVHHALLNGDDVTGATTFRLEAGLDSGPVYGVVTETIRPRDTTGDLLGRLSESGARLLVATVDGIETGALEARPQSGDGVSSAPKLTVEDARVDWQTPAIRIDRQVRACTPDPGAWTTLGDERVKIGPVELVTGTDLDLAPGELRPDGGGLFVGTGSAPVRLGEVRPQGRRSMDAADWARGHRLEPRERFDPPPDSPPVERTGG